ncbi:DUF983 domain-containing protein [Sediminitomix flava]|uniref:Uncharacterized protein DUF983 n=1 Tax=Sediminitomix flava TaxID=379075 RepID=A0A315ZG12_SEDFL|nr:DUF983 domain-containing protein [Sediminitomix flava]PWJ43798.1 uncharacterized protein DUF983 [Sediminitomix flava]
MANQTKTKERSKVEAMIEMKCPACREGNLFKYSLLNKPHKFSAMHDKCPNCNTTYHPEVGFYYGAMYVSYGINTAIFLSLFLLLHLVIQPKEFWVYFAVIFPAIIIPFPFTFRMSRSIYLHLVGGIDYKGKKEE